MQNNFSPNQGFGFFEDSEQEDFWKSEKGMEFVSSFFQQEPLKNESQPQQAQQQAQQPQQRNVYKVVRSSVGKKIGTIKRVAVSTLQGHSTQQNNQAKQKTSGGEQFLKLSATTESEVFTYKSGKAPPRKRKRTSRRTDAEIKEKNRLYAKQHRLDKKRQHEALVKRNEQLELENQRLRTMLASLGITTKKIVNAGSAPIKIGGKAVQSVGKGAFNMLFGKNQNQDSSMMTTDPQMMIPDPSILAQTLQQQQPQQPQTLMDDTIFDIPPPPKAPTLSTPQINFPSTTLHDSTAADGFLL